VSGKFRVGIEISIWPLLARSLDSAGVPSCGSLLQVRYEAGFGIDEVELIVPAVVAYAKASAAKRATVAGSANPSH